MEKLTIRDLQEADISLIDSYWQSLNEDDLKRMCVDSQKRPSSVEFRARLTGLLSVAPTDRVADPLIWEVDGTAIGFANLNAFKRPEQADVHLHMFAKNFRGKGLGRRLFIMSLERYFKRHRLAKIICQPAAANPYPNAMMKALGVAPVKTYRTIPSGLCYEHEVNRYEFDEQMITTALSAILITA